MTPSRLASVTMAFALVGGLLGGHGVAVGRTGQQDVGETAPDVTAEQFDHWMADLSNWGRWGVEDELGTLNLITVSLSRGLGLGQPATFQRGFANVFALGEPGLGEQLSWIEELHEIGYHASPLTHLDALCHVAWNGMTYNGRRFDDTATVDDGCTKNGVGPLKAGIVTRGILMDMPGAGRVTIGDIETWEQESGVTISAGDALFLRTAGQGGYHNSIMPFLKECDVAMIMADRGLPAGGIVDGGAIDGRTVLPMHVFTLVALGMPLIDNVDLEELAETAARLNRWEFLFVVAPLPVDNGAGSAVNPVAVF